VARGAFDKDLLHKLLQLPEHQQVLLAQTVGFAK